MAEPRTVTDIFLLPGQVRFASRDTRIRTLLGSCVAVTLWHPRVLIGGMCHFMLPTRGATSPVARTETPGAIAAARPEELDGRYADEALGILLYQVQAAGTQAGEYEAKIFGGGNQFTGHVSAGIDVATRNVEAGLRLLDLHGFAPSAMHLGGSGHRQVILDLWSGDVWLRHVDLEG
jgi:chemotaxis protein CheD